MAFSVVMPALEMAQETGKLVAWRKHEGERVAKGETLLEIETDKAVMEIEAPADGVLAGVRAQAGAVVPVGQTIAWIINPGEAIPADGPPASSRAVTAPARAVSVAATPERAPIVVARISPKARRLAQERGVDISRIQGSGPGGEVLAADILAAANSRSAPSSASSTEAPGAIARLMAERTTQSWTTVPHFFLVREVDAGALVDARERLGSEIDRASGVRPTHTDLLVAAVAQVLSKHPRMNASWSADRVRLNVEINIAIAMAVEDGVVATVIRNPNQLKLNEIASQRRDLTERAKAGRLRPNDVAGATFTISNLGMYGVDSFSAIISPPQAAILAVGGIRDQVVPVNGAPGIRPMMSLTLSCDHRVLDGARAAVFLNDLVEALRTPEKWLR
jgi:pyruvate dehydrogenase E2 component (dihydrolipoamide acetyltransferase)